MNLQPGKEKVNEIAAGGNYNVVPVSCEILSDFTTPIEVMRILKKASTHCFLLESAQANETWGRYTFLGYDPKMAITCEAGHFSTGSESFQTEDPSGYLRQVLARYKSPRFDYLPTFTGGLVGYFSYDYLGYSEKAVRCEVEDTEGFKDVDLMLFDKVIAFDNLKQKIVLIVNMRIDGENADTMNAAGMDVETTIAAGLGTESTGTTGTISKNGVQNSGKTAVSEEIISKEYDRAAAELERLADLIRNGEKLIEQPGRLTGEVTPLFEKEQYCEMVENGKHYIKEGDIFQIVLSNRLSAPFEGSLFDTYRMLRTINPSPYMFYFSGTDVEVAGASPETLVKLEDGVLHTFPLAGTRPRGKSEEEDAALERELLADEKELAEHNMLVDLGRNDLGKISRFGTVEVEALRQVVRFSHVMHIGSTVRGIIREDKDALDAIEAVLPAGTLSGAPKIRACQLIGQLENNKRGIYGGAIGYIDFTGNMDTCIAIRIAYKKNGKVFVRSGAGIVADSVPEKEFEECLNKAKSCLTALEMEF
ncbi:MAG: anthranilate synthase component I family protein [Lachnospiraceae bacterium]|nr:anthranilate synthase component I family protein [Lachnospiraceae bacterium]